MVRCSSNARVVQCPARSIWKQRYPREDTFLLFLENGNYAFRLRHYKLVPHYCIGFHYPTFVKFYIFRLPISIFLHKVNHSAHPRPFPIATFHFLPHFLKFKPLPCLFLFPATTRIFTFLVSHLPSVSASTLFQLHCTSALPSRLQTIPFTAPLIPPSLYNLIAGSHLPLTSTSLSPTTPLIKVT